MICRKGHIKGIFIGAGILIWLFAATSSAASIILSWDASPDGEGYEVCYKSGFSGPPYDGTGATEGDSCIDVGNVLTYTLTGLSDVDPYFFAVRAYASGQYSNFSNEVSNIAQESPRLGATIKLYLNKGSRAEIKQTGGTRATIR